MTALTPVDDELQVSMLPILSNYSIPKVFLKLNGAKAASDAPEWMDGSSTFLSRAQRNASARSVDDSTS